MLIFIFLFILTGYIFIYITNLILLLISKQLQKYFKKKQYIYKKVNIQNFL